MSAPLYILDVEVRSAKKRDTSSHGSHKLCSTMHVIIRVGHLVCEHREGEGRPSEVDGKRSIKTGAGSELRLIFLGVATGRQSGAWARRVRKDNGEDLGECEGLVGREDAMEE